MPNKTIYIADADMPIFERAQQLAGGNLSATIVQALRRFIETAEAKENDFEEIAVRVGSVAPVRKRFIGRLLTEGHTRELRGATRVAYKVYLTRLGKFALSVEDFADLSGSQWWTYKLNNPRPEKIFRFEVFDTVEDLRSVVPQEVYTAVLQTLTNPDGVEILDI
jgi:EXLDI family protein